MSRVDKLVMALLALGLSAFHTHGFLAQRVEIAGRWFCTFGDDAYISMRYAQHLVDGHGLVWNIGEAPVEGFTNFLWTLWISLLTLVARDPSSLMYASSALFHVGAVVALFVMLRRSFATPLWAATIAALLLATWQPVLTQVRVGLEAPMLLVMFVAAMALLYREPSDGRSVTMGALLAGLLPLVRPDGAFLTAVLGIGLGLGWIRDLLQGRAAWGSWIRITALFVGPFIALSLFRWAYFGDVLPNTYYLKVEGRPGRLEFGLGYVADFLRDFYGAVLLLPVGLSALVCGRNAVRALAIGMAGLLLYIAWQGGDAWNWWRFMIPLLPMLFVALASLTGTLGVHRVGRILCIAAWAFLCFVGVHDLRARIRSGALWPIVDPSTVENIRLGLALREAAAPGAVTADFWAGAAPYYSGLASIDMLGKSDAHIARVAPYKAGAVPGHDKFDFDYVLDRKPDIIISRQPKSSSRTVRRNSASARGCLKIRGCRPSTGPSTPSNPGISMESLCGRIGRPLMSRRCSARNAGSWRSFVILPT
jgi:hypothetical protein